MEQLTLGEIILRLEKIPLKYSDKDKTVTFDFEFAFPTTLDSYRGDYSELAIGFNFASYTPWDHAGNLGFPTLEKVLEEFKSAIGATYEGWKGGYFTMDATTRVWVANPGNTGNTAIVDIIDNSYSVTLITKLCEY